MNTLIAYYKDGDDITQDYMRIVDGMTQEKLRQVLNRLVEQKNIIEVVMSPKNEGK
ncbi:MAG: hypothetical protein J5554_09320 [Paludibacteraceae bacterium]|nr:hypothetical protein [Paludibacteraceae bacterium]